MNTQGFSYWLDGVPVCCVCCLIVLIVFCEPTKSKYKESAVYDCLEIRSVETCVLYLNACFSVCRGCYISTCSDTQCL